MAFVIVGLEAFAYQKLWIKNLYLDIAFTQRTAFEGDTVQITEMITNRKLLPLPWLGVKFEVSKHLLFENSVNTTVSDHRYRNELFSLMMYQRITRNINIKCMQRGYYTITNANMIGNDILFSTKFATMFDFKTSVTVFPKLIDVSELEIASRQLQGQAFANRFINPDPFYFKGIREYMASDELKSINFKASAKTGELMVNVKEYTVSQEIAIILNLEPYSLWSVNSLYEEAIRIVASVATMYIDMGMPVSLMSNGLDLVTKLNVKLDAGSSQEHLHSIYEHLARIDMNLQVEQMSSMLANAVADAGREKVFVIISTYHEDDLIKVYEDIKNQNYTAMWVLPYFESMELNIPTGNDIICWDCVPEEVGV